MKVVILIILFFMVSQTRAETKSTHLTGFKIHQCQEQFCLHAAGDLGYMSMDQDSLSAANVKFEIKSSPQAISQIYFCTSFRYEISSQFFMCENENSGTTSLTVDSKMKIQRYSSSDILQ